MNAQEHERKIHFLLEKTISVTNESGKSKDLLNSARLAKLQLLVLELRKRELRQELTNAAVLLLSSALQLNP
jgi:hypothetical protein